MENLVNIKPMGLEIEAFFNNIPDIISSKIIYSDNEQIEEIHILASDERSPKQISRDIQSALIAKYNIKVDHKKISVAQINEDTKASLNNQEYRFAIGAIGYCLVDNVVEIKVTLKKGNQETESTVSGTNSRNNIYRLVVQATLECIHNFLNRRDVFVFEDIQKTTVARQEVINIGIAFVTKFGEELLVGAAILKKDDYEAIVKATLDAVNRKILQLCM